MPSTAKVEIFHRFHRWIVESWQFQKKQRQRADTAWEFIDGNQWTTTELKQLKADNQAPTVVNVLFPMLSAISSVELNRRTDYNIVPKEPSDESLSEVLTTLAHQVFTENNLKFKLGRGFRSGLITGCSWFEVFMEEDFDTKLNTVKIELRPFEQMFYDPHADLYDLSDARYISREVWMDIEDIEDLYGEEKAAQVTTFFDTHSQDDFHGREEEAQSHSGRHTFIDKEGSRVAVHEMYYKDVKGRIRHVIFSGSVFFKGNGDDDSHPDNDSPYKYNFFPFIPYIALWDKKGAPLGPVEIGRPIQEIINKTQSKQQFLMASRGLIYEEGAFKNEGQAREDWAKPNRKIPLTDGGLAKIREDDNTNELQTNLVWIQFMVQTLQRIMGVNDSLIGVGGTNARSAIQEQGRVSQGEGLQASFIEPLYFTKLAILKVVLKMIGQFYTEKRVVRMVAPNGQNEFTEINSELPDEDGILHPFNHIPDILKFDADVREEAPFSNTRELNARTLSEVLKVVPGITPALIGPIIDSLSGIQNKPQIIQDVQKLFESGPPTQ